MPSLVSIITGLAAGIIISTILVATRPIMLQIAIGGAALGARPLTTLRALTLGAIGAVRALGARLRGALRALRAMRANELGALAGAFTGVALMGAVIGAPVCALISAIILPLGTDTSRVDAAITGIWAGAGAGAALALYFGVITILKYRSEKKD